MSRANTLAIKRKFGWIDGFFDVSTSLLFQYKERLQIVGVSGDLNPVELLGRYKLVLRVILISVCKPHTLH